MGAGSAYEDLSAREDNIIDRLLLVPLRPPIITSSTGAGQREEGAGEALLHLRGAGVHVQDAAALIPTTP